MKRIYLEITPFFPTKDSFRGSFIFDQVKAIQRTGQFDEVLVLRPDRDNYEYEYQGVKVYCFKTRSLPSNLFPGFFDSANKRSFIKRMKMIGIRMQDIIVVHGHVAGQALYVNAMKEMNPGTQTVIQYHDPDPYSIRLGRMKNQLWHRKIVARRSVLLCSQVEVHVGVSQKVIDSLLSFPIPPPQEVYDEFKGLLIGMEKLSPVKAKNVYVMYNGVDTTIFHPDNKTHLKKEFRIGCIANFVDWKDQLTLIKAVEILSKTEKNIEVILIGSGPTLANCRQYVRDHQLEKHITFQHELDHHLLAAFYQTLDLFVLPSFFEGFGCVFAEAYACGVPFMTVANQGISELLPETDHGRWLIKPMDYMGLSQLMAQYKREPVEQQLLVPINIDFLIDNYLRFLEKVSLSK